MMQSFTVRTAADPQALPRVIGQLARLWVTPTRLISEQTDEELHISFVTSNLPPDKAEIVAAALRSSVLVQEVQLRAGDWPADRQASS